MNKTIRISILLFLSLVFTSCMNILTNDLVKADEYSGVYVINGTYSMNENKSPRTAIPDPDISLYTFEVIADSLATPPVASVNGVVDSAKNAYSIELTDGNWKLTINGYKDAAKTKKALTAQTQVTIGNSGIISGSIHFSLNKIQTPALAANAEVLLPVEVDSVISRVEASWKESGIEKKQTIIQNSAATTGNFTMIDDGETTLTATNGNYDVVFRFYKKIGTKEVIAYSLIEKINLYDYLTTNKWLANASSPFYSDGKIKITSDLLKTYEQEIFYVSSTGDDKTNSGGFFDPFATPQPAVDIIQAKGDWDTEYTIYVMDTVTMPLTSVGVDGSMVCIGDSSDPTVAPKITICGYQDDPQCKLDANSAFTYCRVMTIYKGAEVTLGNNLTIQNGVADLGAGVRNYGTLTVDGTSITNNAASSQGGGIYTSDGTVTFNSGSIVNNTAATGGAAMYTANSNVVFSNGIINNSIYIEGVTSEGAGKLEFTSNVRVGAILQFAYMPDGFVPVSMHDLVLSTQEMKAAFVPAAGKTYSDLIGTVFFQGENAGDAFEYPTNVKICTMDGTEVSGYSIDADGKLCGPAIVTPVNGGNNTSSYTVISTIAACGDTAPSTPGVYSLSTETELKKLSGWVNNASGTGAVPVFEDYTFVLYDNIPLTEDWTPIGTYNSPTDMKGFKGTIDGNGNTISNFVMNDNTAEKSGFVKVSLGTTIKNLTIEGSMVAKGNSGAFVAYSYGNLMLDNCVSKVDVTAKGNSNTGGLVGYLSGVSGDKPDILIQNCANFGKVDGSANTGGILGGTSSLVGTVRIKNCITTGDVNGTSIVGGIAGRPVGPERLEMENCIVTGEITGTANLGAIVGGIGSSYTLGQSIDYCYYDENSCENAVGTAVGATYTYGEHFEAFTNNGTSSTLATAVLSQTDVKDALNAWITDASLGNDAAYSTYKQWYYQTGGDGTPTIVPYTVVVPPVVEANVSDLVSAPTDSSLVYKVASMEDLGKLAEWVNADGNTFEGFTFEFSDLYATVNLSGDFTPIGTSSNPFKGTFDGSNVSITGVALSSSTSSLGFFGYAEDATIKNLKIEGSVTSTVSSSSNANAGGLVGVAKGAVTIDNCDVKMVITCSGKQVGGIVGNFESGTLIIRNTINRGGVSGHSDVGGIVGNSYPTATSSSASIFNCINYGSITGTGANVGGILGFGNKTSVENCISKPNGTISGGSNTGKLCGNIAANCNLSYSYFLANTSTETDYTGTTSGEKLNNNIFNINNTKPCFLNEGTDCNGDSYSAGDEVLTIMNKWVEKANVADNIYLKFQYEGGSGELGFDN